MLMALIYYFVSLLTPCDDYGFAFSLPPHRLMPGFRPSIDCQTPTHLARGAAQMRCDYARDAGAKIARPRCAVPCRRGEARTVIFGERSCPAREDVAADEAQSRGAMRAEAQKRKER